MWNHPAQSGAGFVGGARVDVLMADDPWTQDELNDVMDEWNAKRTVTQMEEHEAKLYHAVLSAADWATAADLAVAAGISDRTSRKFLAKWTKMELVEMFDLKPRRYRANTILSHKTENAAAKLKEAANIIGLPPIL